MNTLISVAAAAFVILIVVPIAAKLALRWAGRKVLATLGQHAIDQQPDALELRREAGVSWLDAARMEELARPLLNSGFQDCGVYASGKMPGMKIWFLMNERDAVAAFLYEHPKVKPWVELSVRYNDGSTTALTTLPPTGIESTPPFWHRIRGDGATPTDQLFQRLMKERSPFGVKNLTTKTVVDEFERSYMQLTVWRKNTGLKPEEVAAVVQKWMEKRGATAARPAGPAGPGAAPA